MVKNLCQKWKVKLFFSRRLKQFDGLTWLTLTTAYFTTDLRQWSLTAAQLPSRTSAPSSRRSSCRISSSEYS